MVLSLFWQPPLHVQTLVILKFFSIIFNPTSENDKINKLYKQLIHSNIKQQVMGNCDFKEFWAERRGKSIMVFSRINMLTDSHKIGRFVWFDGLTLWLDDSMAIQTQNSPFRRIRPKVGPILKLCIHQRIWENQN